MHSTVLEGEENYFLLSIHYELSTVFISFIPQPYEVDFILV